MLTTDRFIITNVVGQYSAGGGLSNRPRQWVGTAGMDVECLECGHSWTAYRGAAGFAGTVGGTAIVKCTECGAEEPISEATLRQVARQPHD